MKKVLVPTDFSAAANNALEFAIQSAKTIPTEITLLHAFEVRGSVYTDYMGVNKEFNQQQLDQVRKQLHDLSAEIKKVYGMAVNTTVITEALPKAIQQLTTTEIFDYIIMGSVGAGSEIGKTQTPVFVIPQHFNWQQPSNMLFATNHFEEDPAVLDSIFELAGLFDAGVQVAIFTDEDDDSPYTFLDHTLTLPHYEETLKKKYPGKAITTIQLYGKEFSETLQQHIDTNSIDLLVMVTYHKTLWDRLFHPSMTRQMSYHTKIPLLALPSPESEWRQ